MKARQVWTAAMVVAILALCVGTATGADISGYKFEDRNGNGVWEPGLGEAGLPGIPIQLSGTDDLGAPVTLNTVSSPGGLYGFYNLRAGNYRVVEQCYHRWAPTFPTKVFYTLNGVVAIDVITNLNFGNDTLCSEPTGNYTFLYNDKDNFTGPEPTTPGTGLATFLATNPAVNHDFDRPTVNQWWGTTLAFNIPEPCYVLNAELCIHVRASNGGSANDGFALGDYDQDGRIYSTTFTDLYTIAYPAGDHSWDLGDEMTICLRLDSLPYNPTGPWFPLNILAALQDGDIDVFLQDDTEVDWLELRIETCCPGFCYADGDVNNSAPPLALNDFSYLVNFVDFNGPVPPVPYKCDLNGDGIINGGDKTVFQSYLTSGIGVFAPYGGYPVPCPCDPMLNPMPDSIDIFGNLHVSSGTSILDSSGGALHVTNRYQRQMDGVQVRNLTSWSWYGELSPLDPLGTLPIGARVTVYDPGDGSWGDDTLKIAQTKTGDNTWDLSAVTNGIKTMIRAFYDGDTLMVDSCEPWCAWISLGTLAGTWKVVEGETEVLSPTGIYPTGFKGSTTGKPPTLAWVFPESHPIWTWPGHGIAGVPIDGLEVTFESVPPYRDTLKSIYILADSIQTFSMRAGSTAEPDTLDIWRVRNISLGLAHLSLAGGNLKVSNMGPTYGDGVVQQIGSRRSWDATLANPDQGDTLPIGAKLAIDFRGTVGAAPDQWVMQMSQKKTGVRQWLLDVKSVATKYTVNAMRNGAQVFHRTGLTVADLGTITEPAGMFKSPDGVYPAGFKGSSTGKPAGMAWSYPSGPDVTWNWPAQGVVAMAIDQLEAIAEGTYPIGPPSGAAAVGELSRVIITAHDIPALEFDSVWVYCCMGTTGNTDGSMDDVVDISDVFAVVDYLGASIPLSTCALENDANIDGTIDIGDLFAVIDYLSGVVGLPPCP